MLSISLQDMKLITELSGMSEFEMIEIGNDKLMQKYLYAIGMDCYDFPFVYIPNKHRTLGGKVVTGYRAVGEVRCDPEYRDSYLAGITERLVISSYTDPSKMTEIAELSFKVRDWSEYLNDNDSLDWQEDRAVLPHDQLEEDWQQEEEKIANLADILYNIRGSCYTASGGLKMAEDYIYATESAEINKEKYD